MHFTVEDPRIGEAIESSYRMASEYQTGAGGVSVLRTFSFVAGESAGLGYVVSDYVR